jgi:hypothetical protein
MPVNHPGQALTMSLSWDDPDETRPVPAGTSRGRDARPPLDKGFELRRDRMVTVREIAPVLRGGTNGGSPSAVHLVGVGPIRSEAKGTTG